MRGKRVDLMAEACWPGSVRSSGVAHCPHCPQSPVCGSLYREPLQPLVAGRQPSLLALALCLYSH